MDFTWLKPDFSSAGVALGLLLLGYVVVLEPLLGRRTYAYLRRYRGAGSRALLRVYVLTLAIECSWLVIIGLILLVSPELDAGALGLQLPGGPRVAGAVGFTAAVVLGQLIAGYVVRTRGAAVPVAGDFALLIPETAVERRLAGVVAVGAGIGEEVLVRGLLIAFGVGVLGLSAWVAAAAATVVFGLAHSYQGWLGVLATTVLGAVLAGLYLATESLLLPIVVHIAIDVRGLLLTPRPRPGIPEP